MFGRTYDLPFGFAPMGGTTLAAYMGDSVLAQVAGELNTIMIQSGASLTPMERVRAVGPTAWFQAYLPGEREIIVPLVERAQRAGFDTLVLTVDVQVPANRENNVRSGYNSPLKPTLRLAWDCLLRPRWLFGNFGRTVLEHGMPHLENMGFPRIPVVGYAERPRMARDALSWEHVEIMRRIWKGKLVLKGVLSPQDVRIARESGVDGILVSNHGGRQLDYTRRAAARAPRRGRRGRQHDHHDGRRRPARHRRAESPRPRRAVRLHRPADPLRRGHRGHGRRPTRRLHPEGRD